MKTQTAHITYLSILTIFITLTANAQVGARSAVDVLTDNEYPQVLQKYEATPTATPKPVDTYANAITVRNDSDRSVWITIYNMFGSIRDSGCVRVGDYGKFNNYFGPGFKVRGEVTTNEDCSGSVVFDTNIGVSMPLTGSGVGVSLQNGSPGQYYFY